MITGQPDIIDVIAREGGELLSLGRSLWTLCKLHGEQTASFKISSDRKRGHCFGCGWHGDSIDYVRALHGLSFTEALAYLGISGTRQTPAEVRAAKAARRERDVLVAAFRQWEQKAVNEISAIFRTYRRMRALTTTYTEVELQALAEIQGAIDLLEYRAEILCSHDDAVKFELYMEMTGRG